MQWTNTILKLILCPSPATPTIFPYAILKLPNVVIISLSYGQCRMKASPNDLWPIQSQVLFIRDRRVPSRGCREIENSGTLFRLLKEEVLKICEHKKKRADKGMVLLTTVYLRHIRDTISKTIFLILALSCSLTVPKTPHLQQEDACA